MQRISAIGYIDSIEKQRCECAAMHDGEKNI
jgi:hypothetical protein